MTIADTILERPTTTAATAIVSTQPESPFAPEARIADVLPPEHTYGAASMQVYADGQVAYNTHASADGFLAYVNQFEQTSFRVKDQQVQWWQYDPPFDDWQNNYGCDSVEVFYHAGHGGTDASSGDYSAPLGGAWDNVIFLNSSQMSIGDQRLRYLFLATCEGCMVFAPNNPIRTWNVCNRGFRMLFGATGLIYDDPNYGTNFWNHWNSGDSFSQAWQDSLLDVASSQQPASTAVGSSAADAQARLFNERFFTNATAARDWYWWRWVGNAPSAAQAQAVQRFPATVKFARIVPRRMSRTAVLAAMRRLGFTAPAALPEAPLDHLRASAGDARFAVVPGGYMVEYAPASPVRSKLSEGAILAAAEAALGGAVRSRPRRDPAGPACRRPGRWRSRHGRARDLRAHRRLSPAGRRAADPDPRRRRGAGHRRRFRKGPPHHRHPSRNRRTARQRPLAGDDADALGRRHADRAADDVRRGAGGAPPAPRGLSAAAMAGRAGSSPRASPLAMRCVAPIWCRSPAPRWRSPRAHTGCSRRSKSTSSASSAKRRRAAGARRCNCRLIPAALNTSTSLDFDNSRTASRRARRDFRPAHGV